MATPVTRFKLFPFIIILSINLCIGASAGFITTRQIGNWYAHLNKPPFNPPNWLFGPVWTLLYILIAASAYMVWNRRNQTINYGYAKIIYLLQLSLNFLWSIVFFGLHNVLGALIVIALLLLSIILNFKAFYNNYKPSAWLLLPYFIWVLFAAVLNFSILMLNN